MKEQPPKNIKVVEEDKNLIVFSLDNKGISALKSFYTIIISALCFFAYNHESAKIKYIENFRFELLIVALIALVFVIVNSLVKIFFSKSKLVIDKDYILYEAKGFFVRTKKIHIEEVNFFCRSESKYMGGLFTILKNDKRVHFLSFISKNNEDFIAKKIEEKTQKKVKITYDEKYDIIDS